MKVTTQACIIVQPGGMLVLHYLQSPPVWYVHISKATYVHKVTPSRIFVYLHYLSPMVVIGIRGAAEPDPPSLTANLTEGLLVKYNGIPMGCICSPHGYQAGIQASAPAMLSQVSQPVMTP